MERFKELDKQRGTIEAELQMIIEELTSGPNPAGLKGPLVDAEGFPRGDIDVYNVRHKRHRFACLQTDLKMVMQEIENVMAGIYAETKPQIPVPAPVFQRPASTAARSSDPGADVPLLVKVDDPIVLDMAPFALVDSVQPGTNIDEAGLEAYDSIVSFGSANATNHRELQAIRDIVMRNVNVPIEVVIERNDSDRFRLQLTPHHWHGNGVLGCLLLPYKHSG
ncbi:26S proteasome non-ATPase regulatory subunit [Achlya hypogyna]|uniref:26S proteasome non-ATPase regulatory subunit n=1 Tax=Achlya hypogyna TaxID=1202772 RepID=A0A1V9YCS9_ACHHY|nr:26S proteasome non-ATPase regulatory subunit [Achlya hypogyna]